MWCRPERAVRVRESFTPGFVSTPRQESDPGSRRRSSARVRRRVGRGDVAVSVTSSGKVACSAGTADRREIGGGDGAPAHRRGVRRHRYRGSRRTATPGNRSAGAQHVNPASMRA